MAEFDTKGAASLPFYKRRAVMPNDAGSPLHLRRICGTCAHFQGDLRLGHPVHPCAKFGAPVHRLASAAGCAPWTRPTVKGGR